MLKDITLGQYFPGTSILHRLDPRMKIVLAIAYIVMLFSAGNAVSLVFSCLLTCVLIPFSKIKCRNFIRSLKPILPIIIITAIINAFYTDGHVIFRFYFIKATWEGLEVGVFMTVRLIFLIIGTSLLTYTTSPIQLADGLESLFAPLKAIKVPVHELSMMMTIALRFIPTLLEETDRIISAQKARGADFESGNMVQRIKALMPVLIPLFVSAFRRAEELALAMDCRCYQGGKGRTRLKRLKFARADYLSASVFVVCFAGVILLNIFAPVQFF